MNFSVLMAGSSARVTVLFCRGSWLTEMDAMAAKLRPAGTGLVRAAALAILALGLAGLGRAVF